MAHTLISRHIIKSKRLLDRNHNMILEIIFRLILFIILIEFYVLSLPNLFGNSINEDNQNLMIKSPYNQEFPDCTKGDNAKPMITKSKLKVIACPMIKDEEGFLSEWAAYYKAHGFAHVMFIDDGSTDNFMYELEPWIKTGFVSVKINTTITDMRGTRMKTPFMKNMAKKAILEGMCIKQAMKWDYDYFVSLDLDEYVVPDNQKNGLTFVDAIDAWEKKSGRRMFCMSKYNFASTPHIAEPVHLLTIEAYQTRMAQSGKMNHYTSVAKKCLYKIKDASYRPETLEFIGECCHFHGCQGEDFRVGTSICSKAWKNATSQVFGQEIGGKYASLGSIYHYSRSLEKFALKKKTWSTAQGELPSKINDYSLSYFLHRSVGYTLDTTMNAYSCETRRKWLEVHTDANRYLRFGNSWYRNIEFNKKVDDPEKRGRYGHGKKGQVRDGNPYLYDGSVPPLLKKGTKISKVKVSSGSSSGSNDHVNSHKAGKKSKAKTKKQDKKKVLDNKKKDEGKIVEPPPQKEQQQQPSATVVTTSTNTANSNTANSNTGASIQRSSNISNSNSNVNSKGKRKGEPGVGNMKKGATGTPKGPLTKMLAKAIETAEKKERKTQEKEIKEKKKINGKSGEKDANEDEEIKKINEQLAKEQAIIDAKAKEIDNPNPTTTTK